MTDEERDALLRGIAATLGEQGERLARIEAKVDRIEAEHGGALRAHLEQLQAIRAVLTGDRAQHYRLAERVSELERKAG